MKEFFKTTISTSLLAGLLLLPGGHLWAQTYPNIEITSFPPFGVGGSMTGYASCDETNPCAVAVYIKVNEGWYNKPTYSNPLTPIGTNGSWTCNVTTYPPSDVYATKYAAYLVPLSASNDVPILDGKPLPEELDEVALAKAFQIRTPVHFSSREWEVKAAVPEPIGMPIGPGPNWFSTNNVWVDDMDRLHVKIRREIAATTTNWSCAEIVCGDEFGYGLYRFYLDSPVGDFDSSVVFSPFSYSDHTNYAFREIDIEFTTWNDTATTGNAQYAIQQWTNSVIVERFDCPAESTHSVHTFVWAPWRLDFSSVNGHEPDSTNVADVIYNWSYTDANRIPPEGLVRPRINLYLSGGQPPTDSNEVEVVVSRFEYLPLLEFTDTGHTTSNTIQLTVQQQVPGLLDVEVCTNLSDGTTWQTLETNVPGVVESPIQLDTHTTNSRSYYRGSLHFP